MGGCPQCGSAAPQESAVICPGSHEVGLEGQSLSELGAHVHAGVARRGEMKIFLQVGVDEVGGIERVYLCFDKQGMSFLKEALGPPSLQNDGDHIHLFSESYGISKNWGTPPLSSTPH